MKFALHIPLNNLSFGQTSCAIAKNMFKRGLTPLISPIGNVDLSAQNIEANFGAWLQDRINAFPAEYNKNMPVFKLWHLQDSLSSYGHKTVLMSFFEGDSPSRYELNIVKNNSKVLFTNEYSASHFTSLGCKNVSVCSLFFDKDNFTSNTPDRSLTDRITFNLMGKLEHRKRHLKTLEFWIKRFGDNKDYALNCAIFNPFLDQQRQNNLLAQTVKRPYSNIQFFPFIPTNLGFLDFLKQGSVSVNMSGSEGFGLPEFHSIALGKHAVTLNAHSYKTFANETNSVLVSPNAKIPIYDGIHFFENSGWNGGRIFDFNGDEFIFGCEQAIERVKKDRINHEGLKLQEKFTCDKTVDEILVQLRLLQ